MIKYRPHRGSFDDSMKKSKTFKTIEAMYDHIVYDWNSAGFGQLMTMSDLSISNPIGDDKRCGWKNVRYVCTKRIGRDVYETPQCVGMCSID